MGIVQNVVHVVVRDCHYPGLAVSGFDKRESGVIQMTGVGSRGHVVFGPLKNIPHLFDGFVLAVTCLAPKQQDRGKLARKRSLNVSQNGDQTRTKIAHVQDTNDDHLQLDQPIFDRGAGSVGQRPTPLVPYGD